MVGVFGTLAHLGMSYAVRFAPSTTLAPMQYVELPVATAIGWAVFGELQRHGGRRNHDNGDCRPCRDPV